MRLEIPECRRCCCCFPLRHGIIVFGYINLIFTTFLVVMEIIASIKHVETDHAVAMYKGVIFYSQIWVVAVIFTIDTIFNFVLLVGAHMKKPRLLRAYYYYGITTTLASFVTFIIIRYEELFRNFGFYVLEACFLVSSIGVHVYLLLLVRSELLKMRQSSRFSYVNHAAEIIVNTSEQAGRNPF